MNKRCVNCEEQASGRVELSCFGGKSVECGGKGRAGGGVLTSLSATGRGRGTEARAACARGRRRIRCSAAPAGMAG